jgi:uncharacterized protein HemX
MPHSSCPRPKSFLRYHFGAIMLALIFVLGALSWKAVIFLGHNSTTTNVPRSAQTVSATKVANEPAPTNGENFTMATDSRKNRTGTLAGNIALDSSKDKEKTKTENYDDDIQAKTSADLPATTIAGAADLLLSEAAKEGFSTLLLLGAVFLLGYKLWRVYEKQEKEMINRLEAIEENLKLLTLRDFHPRDSNNNVEKIENLLKKILEKQKELVS